jgi:RNA polymerase sigma-70 factor (ECF subfamily)
VSREVRDAPEVPPPVGIALVVSESSARRQALRDPDVRLMLEVRGDSAEAFEELMLRYQGRLVTILDHLVGDRDQAEDLAQEVFLRVYRARKTYTAGAKFSTWLFTIANNVASNALRTRFRRREVGLRTPDGSAVGSPWDRVIQASSGQMPVRRLDKAEMRDIVRLALSALNERQRLAVLLSKFEGMSYADIAETMELSPQAVKSLLARARVNLREVLEPYLERGDRPALDAGPQPPTDENNGND